MGPDRNLCRLTQSCVDPQTHSEDSSVATIEAVSPLHERLLAAVGDRTYRRVGEITSTHPETVRRYLQGQAPSVEFVMSLCSANSSVVVAAKPCGARPILRE